jgi:hypothetical protein
MRRSQPLFLLLLLFLAACGSATNVEEMSTDVVVTSTAPTTADPIAATAPAQAATTTDPGTTPRPTAEPIGDAEAKTLLEDLSSGVFSRLQPAVDRVLAARDARFAAAFLEMFRINQIGLDPAPGDYWPSALERLTAQSFGNNWPDWVEWVGRNSLAPPPGFTPWKGQLLARIDERFVDFFPADAPLDPDLRPEEIVWGGVMVDGIPALDNPVHIPAAAADYLTPGEPVFGLAINGDARAYPLRLMDWHEMSNDVVGGVPVSLAYCTLCGAAIAYDGRASDGTTYDFGSSGLLYRSNKLMYDRQTNTLWNQLTGRPVLGPLVSDDVRLALLPVVLTTWAEWQAQHPETVVLDLNTGFDRPYELGAAYGRYFAAEETMFPVWRRSDLLPAKSQIYALSIDGQPKAYPLALLSEEQVVNDTVAGEELVLIARGEPVAVDVVYGQAGAVTYSAGGEVRAFARGGRTFGPGAAADEVVDASGVVWQVTEAALVAPSGATLPRVSGHLAYWFGWYAFFPNTLVYGAE